MGSPRDQILRSTVVAFALCALALAAAFAGAGLKAFVVLIVVGVPLSLAIEHWLAARAPRLRGHARDQPSDRGVPSGRGGR